MVANSVKATFVLFLTFVAPICAAIEDEHGQTQIVSYLTDNLMSSLDRMGRAIEACDQIAETRSAPILDKGRLTEFNASREDLLTALAHLSFANHFDCTRQARLSMAYDLGTLVAVQKEFGTAARDWAEVHQEVGYPSARTIHYAVMYKELPVDLRAYAEEIVGQEPFALIDALKANNIFID